VEAPIASQELTRPGPLARNALEVMRDYLEFSFLGSIVQKQAQARVGSVAPSAAPAPAPAAK